MSFCKIFLFIIFSILAFLCLGVAIYTIETGHGSSFSSILIVLGLFLLGCSIGSFLNDNKRK